MDFQDYDLLGDPVPSGFGGRGRPPHVVTDEKRKVVIALWAFGKSNEECAMALGITLPTFNKHYFKNKAMKVVRDEAMLRLQAKTLSALLAQVDAGNVSAIDKMLQRIDRHALKIESHKRQLTPAAPKGKKELAHDAASKVAGKYAPPAQPLFVN
jgi:hypothetical protein